MQKNIGTKDRLIRFSLAIVLFLFAWWQASWIAFIMALFTFYEALASWCLFYQLLGKSSCPIHQKDQHK